MQPDRDRAFTKRGATVGLLAVFGATVILVALGVVVAFLLQLAF